MIVVTGASGGLGRQLVVDLCETDDVVGTWHRQPPEIAHDRLRLFQLDVTQPDSVQNFVEAIRSGTHITLVNLAGLSISRLAVDLSPEDWDDVMSVNLRGTFLMCRALIKLMIRDRWGRIINISSVVAWTGVPGTAAYAASKSGIVGLTRTLAREYARYGITANCLSLGYFEGGLTATLSESQRRDILDSIPLRRFGNPSELADAVRYLIGASYTTGTCLQINGGLV